MPASDSIVLQTLNVHSTIIAQKRTAKELAPFKASFSRFIQSIQDGGYRKFANMPNAPETKAMEQFWSDYRELIKKNPRRMLNSLEYKKNSHNSILRLAESPHSNSACPVTKRKPVSKGPDL